MNKMEPVYTLVDCSIEGVNAFEKAQERKSSLPIAVLLNSWRHEYERRRNQTHEQLHNALAENVKLLHLLADREARVEALTQELATILDVAIARGVTLGYDDTDDYVVRYIELTGKQWDEGDDDDN